MKLTDGVYTALITPFQNDMSLDLEGLKENINFQMESGVQGVVALGTTGECPTIEEFEKELIISAAKEALNGRGHLMVGTGSYSTKATIKATKKASELGADSALVVAPYYNKPPQEGLIKHFLEVADASLVPIILYNVPVRCVTNIELATYLRLVEHENIIGIKEASGNILFITEVIRKIREKRKDILIFSGDDTLTLPILSLGGNGVISVASNLIPYELQEFVRQCLNFEYQKAQTKFYELFPLFQALFLTTNPIPVKKAMALLNRKAGPLRLPLIEMNEALTLKLTQIMNETLLERSLI
ncbi:4-hydroxy-tetrahydrodipicolinate synthase [Criblamydia sequanensis]|uniref:4-hydroxy-tetrahydrodipicolinate synthase n=1 Tax=Candidatus Criblamydia sequanensis CRIB-18 TaxID=1437425 RepID=A0A090D3C0_9BACT|nr:4-hydroxy-tetrahydrodipicolinate synthase [Criblamydia sequanensis]CDR35118.1 Dihydrodipicolinate synthase [Criblamydia sequanensis CRIB-18]